jgi:hypothetical protein
MGCLSFFLFSAALFGSQPYWSLFMQNTWGFTPLQGGLAFLPATGLIALFTPLSGLMAQWAGPRLYVFLVLALLAIEFIVSGEGASRLIIEEVILQGFKLTALTCLVLCGSAAVLAFFIRTRLRKKGFTYPVQKEEQRLSVSPDG